MKSLRSLLDASTYARARLNLGLFGVGAVVLLSLIALAWDIPTRVFGHTDGGLFTNASLLAVWLSVVSLLSLPLEITGGHVLPKKYGRSHPEVGDWVLSWLRGVLVIILTMSLSGALIILAGKYVGRFGAIGMLGVLTIILAALQTWIARLVGGLRVVHGGLESIENEMRQLGVVVPPITILESTDEGFTGGIGGLPTAEHVVLPQRWITQLEPAAMALLISRRVLVVDRALRAVGLISAIAWVMASFGFASAMPGAGVATVAGLVSTSLWFTVFSFLGLLILPTPNRAGTLAADAYTMQEHDGGQQLFEDTLKTLDTLQDDEPERSESLERFFHPIPSFEARKQALSAPEPEKAPWNVARTALFLSMAGMNPLGRLVHCNVGRPDLWVFLPSDG